MLERYKNIIFAVVILAIVTGVIALLTYHPAPVVITIIPPAPTTTPGPIRVSVAGAVQKAPNVYALPFGSRVQDAIAAAGGASASADLASVNLAGILHDGDKVNVPALRVDAGGSASSGAAQPASASSSASSSATKAKGSTVVHINTASLDELELLPGVGPALAQKILDYRAQHGAFKSMADLDNVSGIGPSREKDWADLIAFD